jgi:flagellar assembly protein FliH
VEETTLSLDPLTQQHQAAGQLPAPFVTQAASPVGAGAGILIRGDEAARAKPVDLTAPPAPAEPTTSIPSGPWAEQLNALHESARRQGFEQGRAEGRAAGIEMGRNDAADMLSTIKSATDNVLSQIEARLSETEERVSAKVVDLALEIAEAVLRREVSVSTDPGAEAIARCLEMAPSTGDLFARLHPQDAAEMGRVTGLGDRGLMITPDPSLQRGDALVTIDDATIDARLNESLRRVAEVLR